MKITLIRNKNSGYSRMVVHVSGIQSFSVRQTDQIDGDPHIGDHVIMLLTIVTHHSSDGQ